MLAARDCNVRMPRPQIRLETCGQRCVLHAFVQVKKLRMPCSDSDPDHLRLATSRKTSHSLQRKKKWGHANRPQIFAQDFFGGSFDVSEETQRQMYLLRLHPTNAVEMRIERTDRLPNGF